MKRILANWKRTPVAALLGLAMSCATCVLEAADATGVQPSAVEQLGRVVEAGIEDGYCSGAVVLAGGRDRVLLHEAFGHAQVVPEKVPMRKDAIFDLASVTKVVATTTACAICVDRGLLDLDQPIGRYLPGLTGEGSEKITVRQLGAHVSGLDNTKFTPRRQGEAMIRAMLAASPRHAPGTHYEYSCLNFILLGLTVEKVAGQPLDRFCQDRIFQPLGMRDTSFGPLPASARVVATSRPIVGEINDDQARLAGRAVGNAGLFSTAADLARFCQMMLQEGRLAGSEVLSQRVVRAITRHSPTVRAERGFGWDLNPQGRPKGLSAATYYHTGYTGQSMWIDPEKKLYVIVLTNRNHPKEVASRYEPAKRFRVRVAEAAIAACHEQTQASGQSAP